MWDRWQVCAHKTVSREAIVQGRQNMIVCPLRIAEQDTGHEQKEGRGRKIEVEQDKWGGGEVYIFLCLETHYSKDSIFFAKTDEGVKLSLHYRIVI